MGLYANTSLKGLSSSVGDPLPTNSDEFNLASELSNATRTAQSGVTQLNKGPNPKDSLEKDALVRQMGVTLKICLVKTVQNGKLSIMIVRIICFVTIARKFGSFRQLNLGLT
ncbi:hypothetical protein PRUPE_2G066700 [Prunus persica]|uniref:Uncharacterized protein n=1 Tax=Prunus persica TaxID=3760 RepID=M5XQ33_PRUPE|nr:hypothetical protein PRUPE_2G066700 [Prunus persica]